MSATRTFDARQGVGSICREFRASLVLEQREGLVIFVFFDSYNKPGHLSLLARLISVYFPCGLQNFAPNFGSRVGQSDCLRENGYYWRARDGFVAYLTQNVGAKRGRTTKLPPIPLLPQRGK